MPIDKNTDFEEVTFHPSLDIKNGILVLGFRIQTAVDKEEEIYLVTSKDSVWLTKEKSFTIDNRNYYIDLKKKKLAKLSRKWDKKQLEAFCEEMQKNWKRPNPAEVFGKLKNLLRVYMDIDDVDYTLLAIWAIGTYFFPIFSAYPYLHIKAPKGSGKTQCLSFLNQVCFNAVKARASLPALRDTIDAQRGTYLMDQADALYRINMEDLLDILTDSYKRGGGEIRKLIADKGKSWNLEEFQAYGPKGFASILPLPEDLRDRCLIISLTKSNKNLGTLDEEDAIWKEMRGSLYKLLVSSFLDVSTHYELKKTAYRHDPSPTLVGRQLELWLPFEVLMNMMMVPEIEQAKAKEKFQSQYNFAEYQVSDLDRAVMETIQKFMVDKTMVVLSPKEIAGEILKSGGSIFEDISSIKQQSVLVGKIIVKYNLPSQKLPRSNRGERYQFTREHIEKVNLGYFTPKTNDVPTPTYTEENNPINIEDFW